MKKEISKNILYNPPIGCFPFANSRFQMGVTVMGFAEDFGHSLQIGPCWVWWYCRWYSLEYVVKECWSQIFWPATPNGTPTFLRSWKVSTYLNKQTIQQLAKKTVTIASPEIFGPKKLTGLWLDDCMICIVSLYAPSIRGNYNHDEKATMKLHPSWCHWTLGIFPFFCSNKIIEYPNDIYPKLIQSYNQCASKRLSLLIVAWAFWLRNLHEPSAVGVIIGYQLFVSSNWENITDNFYLEKEILLMIFLNILW